MQYLKTHSKIIKGDIAYYVHNDIFENPRFHFMDENSGTLKLMQMAEVAINLRTNVMIKCRFTLEDLLDNSL